MFAGIISKFYSQLLFVKKTVNKTHKDFYLAKYLWISIYVQSTIEEFLNYDEYDEYDVWLEGGAGY